MNGTEYKPNGAVVLEVDHIPTFGIITDILAMKVDNYYLVCELMDTECFNSHFHSYEISRYASPHYIICKFNDHNKLCSQCTN